MLSTIRSEAAFIVTGISVVVLYTVGAGWLYDLSNPLIFAGLFVWIFGVMVWSAFAAVRHADSLAELLGEPYGTLILTISVISWERRWRCIIRKTRPFGKSKTAASEGRSAGGLRATPCKVRCWGPSSATWKSKRP
jgi:hypothetical protein